MFGVGNLTDTELLKLVDDIYDWNHSKDGTVKTNSFLYNTYNEKVKNEYYSINQFSDDIVNEAADRFEKLIKTTMSKCAFKFIAR